MLNPDFYTKKKKTLEDKLTQKKDQFIQDAVNAVNKLVADVNDIQKDWKELDDMEKGDTVAPVEATPTEVTPEVVQ